MAVTKRIEWVTIGYWGQWEKNLTLWSPEDVNGILWSQVFSPHSRTDRFSMTKVRFKLWRTGAITDIGLLIYPMKAHTTDMYNYSYGVKFSESPLAMCIYSGAIPESDPGDDTSNWIEFELDAPLIVEGGESHRGYAIVIAVAAGAGTLHWAYSMPKSIPSGCGEFYTDGYICKGVYPYVSLTDWWNVQFTYCTSNFLFEIWGEDAAIQVPLVTTKGYKLDKELPRNCIVRGGVHPWCGAKVTNKGIRWYKDGDSDNKFWKGIDVPDGNYNFLYQDFNMELTDLEYNTKYYYRVEATNSAGVGEGEYESFTSLYPETSLKIEIKAEAIATDAEIERVGPSETLLINNHLIQTKVLAQVIADYYLAQYKDPKIVIRGNIITPAPYERRDAIVFGEGEILNYTKAISAEISYAALGDSVVPYNYFDIATYGRMFLKKINPIFSAGNYVASIELERKY